MRDFGGIDQLHYWGWRDDDYDRLVEIAAQTIDRSKRLALYRKADFQLVSEQAHVLPVDYYGAGIFLVKPWVKNFYRNAIGTIDIKDIIIEPH